MIFYTISSTTRYAGVAQSVERNIANVEAVSSKLITCTIYLLTTIIMLRTFEPYEGDALSIQANKEYLTPLDSDIRISEDRIMIYVYRVMFGYRVVFRMKDRDNMMLQWCAGNDQTYINLVYNQLMWAASHKNLPFSSIYSHILKYRRPHHKEPDLYTYLSDVILAGVPIMSESEKVEIKIPKTMSDISTEKLKAFYGIEPEDKDLR